MARKYMVMKYAVAALLLMLSGFGGGTALAQGSSLQLSFGFLTAPHAAVGAPVQWTETVTNTGAASVSQVNTVTLVAPDGSTYSVLSQTGSLKAGGITSATKTTTTSTYTSQTGNFSLVATVKVSGVVVATQTIPLTVTAVPSSSMYVSVGGIGPGSAVLGNPTTYRVVVANLSGSAASLKANSYIVMPDSTQNTIQLGTASSVTAGGNTITETTINTPVWSAGNGNFSILVKLLDTSNNILSTDTYTFTRTPVPATAYVPTFTDKATASGITLTRTAMAVPAGCKASMMGGSGAAVADFDGDGYDDLFVIDMMGMGTLYRNNHDGTFTDVTVAASIPMVMDQSAAIWADVDNDGRPDLLILTFNMMGTSPTVLLHNNGPNASGVVTFTDVTATSGIVLGTQNPVSATFGDYDNDGFLDLYVAVHADCSNGNTNDHLFHNNGNGTFTDRTDLLGGSTGAQVNHRGLVTVFADYNNDGRVDLYVGNDEGSKYGANVLWRNDGPGGTGGWLFTDVSSTSNAGVSMSDMGIAVLDYNRDGLFDFFLTNVGKNSFLQGLSGGTFKSVEADNGGAHVARKSVPSTTSGKDGMTSAITWGAGGYDFNNDGWEDIFEAGGPIGGTATYNSALFLNNQDGTFLDVSPLTGALGLSTGMPTAVFADFNNDGFMDMLVFGMAGSPQLLMNNARSNGNPYNWLQVKLVGGCTTAGGCTGTFSSKDAIGARIVANVGTAKLWRQVIDGATYQGNSTLVQHFGLGTATQVDSLTVYWPSGKTTTMTNVAANQKIIIQEQ